MDNFMGPPFFNNRQPPVSNFGEFIPDVSKLDLPWDNTRPMSDVPDKLVSSQTRIARRGKKLKHLSN